MSRNSSNVCMATSTLICGATSCVCPNLLHFFAKVCIFLMKPFLRSASLTGRPLPRALLLPLGHLCHSKIRRSTSRERERERESPGRKPVENDISQRLVPFFPFPRGANGFQDKTGSKEKRAPTLRQECCVLRCYQRVVQRPSGLNMEIALVHPFIAHVSQITRPEKQ